jgi:hypothetical protein
MLRGIQNVRNSAVSLFYGDPREQPGLKLEPTRGPAKIPVIDHVERPVMRLAVYTD